MEKKGIGEKMSDVVNKMLGREEFHEAIEKRVKKLHSDKCSCDRCMEGRHRATAAKRSGLSKIPVNDKYGQNDIMYVAGTPVSLNRP